MINIIVTEKIELHDLKRVLANTPLKPREKNQSLILRAFVSAVRKNKIAIFDNKMPVDFVCNGYDQVNKIVNNGIDHDLNTVINKLYNITKQG